MSTTKLLRRRTALFAKAETDPGTAETLAAADGKLLAINPTFTTGFETYERQVNRDTFSNVPKTITTKVATLAFDLEVRRSNTGATPDFWGQVLLPACGFKETIGGSSVTYTPSSTSSDWHTLTLGMNIDGFERIIAGAMGNIEFRGTVGEVMLFSCTFQGFLSSHGDATLPSVTHETGVPHPFQGIDLAYATGTRFVLASASTAATAGTFTITADGLTTGTVPFDDDGTDVQAELAALFPDGVVTTTMLKGTDLSDNLAIMLVEISSPAHKTVTITTGGLTGSAHRIASTVVQVTAAATAATAGTFTLQFDQNGANVSASIAYNADASAIETAIDALSIFTASEAIFSSGSALGTNNASVFILCDLDSSGGFTNYHVRMNTSGLTGNVHTANFRTQEVVTGSDLCLDAVTIALGNDVQPVNCANNAAGVTQFLIVDRNPTVTINPLLTKEAEVNGLADYWDHLDDQEMSYISFHAGTKGGTASRVAFTMPEVFLEDIGDEDRNGSTVAVLTGSLTSDTAGGDDELAIVMT